MQKSYFVTGAGGGMGGLLARRLLERGERVFVSDIAPEPLAELVALGAIALPMDVSSDDSVAQAFAQVDKLDAVVHCAAICPVGTVEFTSPVTIRRVFDINTLGSLRVLQASLPLLRARKGRILLISSLWGRVSGPFESAYAASKHALEALADATRRETQGQGVDICLVEPGVIRTAMYYRQIDELNQKIAALGADEAKLYGGLYEGHRALVAKAEGGSTTTERCVATLEAILDAARPKTRYVIGKDAKALIAMSKLLSDRGLDRLFGLLYRKMQG